MIYMAYNAVNGKYYVGQTLNLAKRKCAHKMKARLGAPGLLNAAIREHGFEAFQWFVLS